MLIRGMNLTHAVIYGVAESQTWLSDWTTMKKTWHISNFGSEHTKLNNNNKSIYSWYETLYIKYLSMKQIYMWWFNSYLDLGKREWGLGWKLNNNFQIIKLLVERARSSSSFSVFLITSVFLMRLKSTSCSSCYFCDNWTLYSTHSTPTTL